MSSSIFGPSRDNTWRVELLDLDLNPLGDLDLAEASGRPGVQPGAQLDRGAYTDLKETGKATVISRSGQELDWTKYRLRLWYTGTGSDPQEPLSTLIPTAAPETVPATHTQEDLELHSTLTLLAEDGPGGMYGVPAGTVGRDHLVTILELVGVPRYSVAESTLALNAGLVWEANTSWLSICNKLCSTIGFASLTPDPFGVVLAERYVEPRRRPRAWTFDVGKTTGLYMPGWKRDRDLLLPNRVVVIQKVEGEEVPLEAEAVLPPEHPRSAAELGRTITKVYTDQDFADQTAGDLLALRYLSDIMPSETRTFTHPWLRDVKPGALCLHQAVARPDMLGTVSSQTVKLETGGLFETVLRGVL